MTLPRRNGRAVSAEAYAFHEQIDRAMARAGLDEYVRRGSDATVVLGPGYQVDIIFEIDTGRPEGWDRLVLSPSESEPPRWRAALRNETTGAVAPPLDDAREHDTLDAALKPLIKIIRAHQQPEEPTP